MLNFLMHFAATCQPKESFFGLPTWYKYLNGTTDAVDPSKCIPYIDNINNAPQLWGIALAAIDILLRVAGMAAVAYIIVGGVQYMASQGNPENAAKARTTLLNALIGLTIVILAIGLVTFLGSRL